MNNINYKNSLVNNEIVYLKNLQKTRESKKMTQVKLATLTNLSQQSITYYETGTRTPSLDAAVRLAKSLNTSIDYLVGLNNKLNDFYELSSENQETILLMIESLKNKNKNK